MKRVLLSLAVSILLVGCDESEISLEESDSKVEEIEVSAEPESVDEGDQAFEEPVEDDSLIYFLTSEEKDYIDIINNVISIQTETIQSISNLVSDANTGLVSVDENFINYLKSSYVKLKVASSLFDEVKEKSLVPMIFDNTHIHLSSSINYLLATEGAFVKGLVSNNSDIVMEGWDYMKQSQESFEDFRIEFEKVTEVYN